MTQGHTHTEGNEIKHRGNAASPIVRAFRAPRRSPWRARGLPVSEMLVLEQSRRLLLCLSLEAASPGAALFPLGGPACVFLLFIRALQTLSRLPFCSLFPGLHQARHDWYFEMDSTIYTLLRLYVLPVILGQNLACKTNAKCQPLLCCCS